MVGKQAYIKGVNGVQISEIKFWITFYEEAQYII